MKTDALAFGQFRPSFFMASSGRKPTGITRLDVCLVSTLRYYSALTLRLPVDLWFLSAFLAISKANSKLNRSNYELNVSFRY
jgi:hypothetical protein